MVNPMALVQKNSGDIDRYIGAYLPLMKFLASIDPKKQVKAGEQTFQKLGMGIIVFFAALSLVITYATVNHTLQVNKLLLPAVYYLCFWAT